MKKSKRLENFSVWKRESKDVLKIPCKNRYGNVAHFEDHDGVILIGFGTEEGFEPDKDALKFDKEDLPKVTKGIETRIKVNRAIDKDSGLRAMTPVTGSCKPSLFFPRR